MLKSSWFLSFIDLYDRDPSAMIQEYKDNDIEYMIKKYTISKEGKSREIKKNMKKIYRSQRYSKSILGI